MKALMIALVLAAPACMDAAPAAPDAAHEPDAGAGSDGSVPVACDGRLCETSNGSACNAGGDPGLLLGLVLVALWSRRSRRASVAALTCVLAVAHTAGAEPADRDDAGVDVRVASPPPAWRRLSLEWNPLPLVAELGKLSANVVIVPKDHHALVVSPFATRNNTAAIYVFDAMGRSSQLPEQDFLGLGVEVGYRYYTGLHGPRGWFVGPSLVLGYMHEKQGQYGDGSHHNYADLGLALDVGYQVLVTDALTLSVGVGAQAMKTSTAIPHQQFPADIYANSGVWPRLLFSVGYAL